MITGFPADTTKDEISVVFSHFGKIVDLFTNKMGHFMFIQFEEESSARRVLNSVIAFKGKKLIVKPRRIEVQHVNEGSAKF